ncbi:family 17 glycoside hydrolase [Cryphonectria parasitica EP155]|uniref:Probable beta-glucosidase btgE n=1 Tax=Cryphonectria parasitica (strain ATCC 38755 / EP155) TaxID=660469 RepID=A0A9P4Y9Q3_CRYP1|nr:family 17 glycoside hydrolase [Cryphonectria parasitica EP155]KAF3769076.1 family 17 glycoside hydrolase [Cryphonectria parasitica EP155]
MKGSVMAVAALLGGASAHNQQRHGHDAFHMRRQNGTDKACTPVVKTITGDFIWTPTPDAKPANPDTTTSTTIQAPSSHATSVTAAASTSSAAAIPTPAAQTCPTSGTYTFPASTLTVTATTSAVVPSSTVCTAGTYTLGGTTTVVETSTVVTCPYATVSTNSAGVVTSVIKETVYTCPAAGTYTIVPGTTTTVTAPSETVTVPVISTYLPGTYTAPAVTTEVVTATVVYCPFASVEASTTAAPVVASSVAAVAETPSSSAAPVVVASSASVVASASVSSASSAASSSSSSSSSTATLGGSGSSPWSLTYTPYNSLTGDCQTAEAVEADLAAVAAAGFSSVRVYSTDCDTLPNVGAAAAKWGLKIIAGIYIGDAGCTNDSPDVADQIAAFQSWEHMDLVELFAVANEAYNNGYCTASELAALVTHVKSELGSLYSGPWTTTDVVATWQDTEFASALCPLIDVVAANAHAYFTSTVAPSDAGPFVKSQLDIIEGACSGLTGYILESGYPTSGDTIGLAVPSIANQALAITSILETVGDRVVLFSMFDDKWKAAGEYNCEQSWGIVPSLFGTVGAAWEALVAAL